MVTFPAQPSWPLNPFFNKIREMDTTQITKDSIRWFLISADFHAFNAEIQSFFGMIRLIKARIDENIKVVRKDPYPFQYIGPINVDFFSFIIFARAKNMPNDERNPDIAPPPSDPAQKRAHKQPGTES